MAEMRGPFTPSLCPRHYRGDSWSLASEEAAVLQEQELPQLIHVHFYTIKKFIPTQCIAV